MSPLKEISRNKMKQKLLNYQCDHCEEKFQSELDLISHMLIHQNKCGHCDKNFSSKSNLKRHKENVHGILNKSLNDSEASGDEVDTECKENVSIGETSKVCDICDKSFSTRGNLNKHKKNVHQETDPAADDDEPEVEITIATEEAETIVDISSDITAVCDVCQKGFKGRCGKSNMERHKNNLHSEGRGDKKTSVVEDPDDTDEEDNDLLDNEEVTDLDVATDYYNRILLGLVQ